MKKRSIVLLTFLACTGGSALVFQNCTKTGLTAVEEPQIQAIPVPDLKSSVCSKASFSQESVATKFIFMVDLSASNFGDWTSEIVGGQKLSYWDSSLATDHDGGRFETIKFFLDHCAQQTGNQYALIGFSAGAGVLGGGRFSCDNVAFGSASTLRGQIDALKARQAQDEAWYVQWKKPRYLTEAQPDSLLYGVTSYTSAMSCLQRLMIDDLSASTANQTDRYRVFFISDGVPQDKAKTGCNLSSLTAEQKQSCYLSGSLDPMMMIRTAAFSRAKDLKFEGIYYGKTASAPVVMNALSNEGGSGNAIQMSSFGKDQTALCNLVMQQSSLDYRPDVYSIVNLTAIRKAGRLLADSDMDGIPDEEEEALGFDPTNPRSAVPGVLDGICQRLGGVTSCREKMRSISCDPTLNPATGLTACDLAMLGISETRGDAGVDTDRDGLPDFVEILKGTDPLVADMTADPDGDGVTTLEEIVRGSDPFTTDANLLSDLLTKTKMKFDIDPAVTSCPNGSWSLGLDQLARAKTLKFSGPASDFNHEADEQVLYLYYRLSPTNSLAPQMEYYGRLIKVLPPSTAGTETPILQTVPNRVLPQDFSLLGKIAP